MTLTDQLTVNTQGILQQQYRLTQPVVEWQPTRKEFEGDLTLVVFPYLGASRKKPEATAQEIGELLSAQMPDIATFNVVKGFLNIVLSDAYWLGRLRDTAQSYSVEKPQKILVEYSSPNTNKPLHLGHIRNILLGFSVARILGEVGHSVTKTQIINDRGIHICKSMLAWQKFGAGETPESTGMKGDHLVGKYYVIFDKAYKKELAELQQQGLSEAEAEARAPLMQEARDMLKDWEAGEEETVALWQKMNQWVYQGFEKTYAALGVDFHQNYYESETYLLGKDQVLKGLREGVFFQKEDGSVWCNLEQEQLGEKLLLRKDGTSVYMTQDIGTAIQRYQDHGLDGMIYTVGNEQDHHFRVLFAILKKLGYPWAEQLYHLSYGMVDLPTGKMKSREGTVVDADDLVEEMRVTAQSISEELGKTEGMEQEEKHTLYDMVGLGALKYYILKVDPKKRMLFNPEESVDFQGNTGPFIQYTHARIRTLLRKGASMDLPQGNYSALLTQERELIKTLLDYPARLREAAEAYAPSIIANYVYDLVKLYNVFYQQVPILTDQQDGAVAFRMELSERVAETIDRGMHLLGIQVPERM